MNLFGEVVTPPTHLPITVSDEQAALARAVVDECERAILWRAIVNQGRRIIVDGPLPSRLEIEPVTAVTSLTRWTPNDAVEVVDADSYYSVTRDGGTLIEPAPGYDWPAPERAIGSFTLTYECGWTVTPESAPGAGDAANEVPASILLMLNRAIAFRSGAGLGDLRIGSLQMDVAASYSTDALPPEIASIGRAWAFRPGVFAAYPRHRAGYSEDQPAAASRFGAIPPAKI